MDNIQNKSGAAAVPDLADTAADISDINPEHPDTKQKQQGMDAEPADTNREPAGTDEEPADRNREGRCRPKGARFASLIRPLSEDPRSQDMKQYIQHGKITTYDHCMDVAKTSYKLGAALHLKVHEKELVRGAFLHDYFLYDWHHHDKPWHGYTHPSTAVENADRDFDATPLEKEIIRSHMWPLTLRTLPRSREAVLVCIADKICSLKETLFHR